MAEFLTIEEVRSYGDSKANLEALASQMVPRGDGPGAWVQPSGLDVLKEGQHIGVSAMGMTRMGVVVKIGRTKVTVAFTTNGAIADYRRGNRNGVRVQTTAYAPETTRVAPAIEADHALALELDRMWESAKAHAKVTGSVGASMTRTVDGVEYTMTWTRPRPVETADMTGSWPVVADFKLPTDGLTNWGRRMVERAAQVEVYRGVAQVADQDEVAALEVQTELEGPEERYGLEVLKNGQVAITDDWRGSWAGILSGRDALEVATRSVRKMNRQMIGLGGGRTPGRHDFKGETVASVRVCQAAVGVQGGGTTPCLLPPEDPTHRPAPTCKVRPGDVVTIHRGVYRFEVERVELDAFASGERQDMAFVACIDEPGIPAQWMSVDLLHVVETSAGDTGAILFAQRRLEREVRVLRAS